MTHRLAFIDQAWNVGRHAIRLNTLQGVCDETVRKEELHGLDSVNMKSMIGMSATYIRTKCPQNHLKCVSSWLCSLNLRSSRAIIDSFE